MCAVVGTGSTGVQIVNALTPIVGHLTVFQRVPGGCSLRVNMYLRKEERRRFSGRLGYRLQRFKYFYREQTKGWGGKNLQPGKPQKREKLKQRVSGT